MSATLIDFILAVIAGVLGGVAVGKGLKELGLGIFVAAVAGVGVTATPAEQTALLTLAGATEGAVLALGVGIVKMMISEHRQK